MKTSEDGFLLRPGKRSSGFNIKDHNLNLVAMAITLLFGFVGYFNVKISLLLLVGIVFVLFAMAKPWLPLALFIIVTPLSNTSLLGKRIGVLPGMEVLNLLLLCAVFAYILSNKHLRISKGEIFIITLVAFVHLASFLKSIPSLPYINAYFEQNVDVVKYFISYFIKEIMHIVPFFLMVGYIRKKDEVYYFYKIVVFSIFVLSISIIFVYVLNVPNKVELMSARLALRHVFGFHTNYIAMFYVFAYPFVLTRFIHKRDAYSTTCLLMTLIAVGVLYSRTAYVLVIFSTIILFFFDKNKKWFIGFCLLFIFFMSFSGTTIKERFMAGVEKGDVGEISSGRVTEIWPSVFENFKREPLALVFGHGRYSMVYARGIHVELGHPHNMYLEAILDSGVVGMVLFMCCFIYIIKRLSFGVKNIKDERMNLIVKASIISVVVYLISGITGRSLFPNIVNSYLWVVMGIGLSAVKTMQQDYSNNGG